VKLSYDGRVTTWNGTVTIAGAFKSSLERALHQTEPGAPTPPTTHSWSPLEVAGGAAALGCVAGAVVLRRRRREVPALTR